MKKRILSILLIVAMLAGIFAVDAIVAPGKASAAVGDSITVQFDGKGYVKNDGSLIANTVEYLEVVNTDGYGDYRPVFCGEHDKVGDPSLFNKFEDTKTYSLYAKITTDRIRKVLYYGYEGPEEWSGFMAYQNSYRTYREQYLGGSRIEDTTMNRAVKTAITANALSYVVGTATNREKYPGVDAFLSYIDSKPAPSSDFAVYQINGGGYQHLFTWKYEKGYAQITKTSSMPEVTNGNGYYGSMNDAVFGVYDGNKKIGEIKANGPAVEFPIGNYTIKEITTPKNFYTMADRQGEIVGATTKKWTYENVPKMDPIQVLLKKVKADGTTSTKLAGAEYTVKYYAATSATGTPERTWVMKTDSRGMILMDATHKVSGPAFYYNKEGVVSFPYGTVTIKETKSPAGFLINPEVITVKIDGKVQAFTQANAPVSKESEYGAIRIKKVDQNGKAMSGVVFGVYSDKNCTNKVASVTTNSLGEATYGYNSTTGEYTLEPAKTFYFKEASTLPGYQISTEVFPVTVQDGKTTRTEKNAVNKELGAIRIRKVDQNGNPMAGVIFNVYTDAACTNKVAGVTTNTEGFATYGYNTETKLYTLTPGKTYYFKEASTLAGYQISTEVFPVTVVSGKTTRTEKNAVNKELGAIRIKKVDQNGKAMAGVIFNVYTDAACTNKVAGVTTNANGEATYGYDSETKLYTLTPGKTYYFKEASTLAGYQISTEVFPVTVVSGKTTMAAKNAVNIQNGALKIKKLDQYNEPIGGVEFTVYDDAECTKTIGTMTTGDDGYATYGYDEESKLYSLIPGKTYYVKETKALPGYILLDEVFDIKIESGKITEASKSAVNTKYGAIRIKKISENNKPLEGAEFTVYDDAECTKTIGTMTTGDDGYATYGYDDATKVYSLTPGETYYVKETKAPTGFILSDDVFSVTVVSDKITESDKPAVNSIPVGKIGISKTALIFDKIDEGKVIIDGKEVSIFTPKFLNGRLEATFEIYAAEDVTLPDGVKAYEKDELVDTITTSDSTAYSKELHLGKYYVKEIKTPDGYVLDEQVKYVEITADENLKVSNPVLNVENRKIKTEILIKKAAEVPKAETVDGLTQIKIEKVPGEGFMFGLFTDENITLNNNIIITKDSLVLTGKTNANGELTFTQDVLPGKYYVKELALPDDADYPWIMSEENFPIDLTSEKAENGKITVEVFKDLENGELLNKVKLPKIKTKAFFINGEIKTKVTKPDGLKTVNDEMYMEDMVIGETYIAKGKIVNPYNPTEVIATAEKTFIYDGTNSTQLMTFNFDASTLVGKTFVIMENLFDGEGNPLSTHSDLTDEDQTIRVAGVLNIMLPKDIFGTIIVAQTGDDTSVLPYVLLITSATILLIILSRRKIKGKGGRIE